MILDGLLKVLFVKTSENVADVFTKNEEQDLLWACEALLDGQEIN